MLFETFDNTIMFINLRISRLNLKPINKLLTRELFRRYSATTVTKSVLKPNDILTEKDTSRFKSLFPQLVKDLTACNEIPLKPAVQHFQNALEYNVPYGEKQRGMLTVAAYKILNKNHSEEQLVKASILGWCVELLQAFLLVADDIMDQSSTRRGQPCWYRKENVGIHFAVNDISMLNNGVYQLLLKYFGKEEHFFNYTQLFHEITMNTLYGQSMDVYFAKIPTESHHFTQENHDNLCQNKTSLYTFYLPVALAMNMAKINEEKIYSEAKKMSIKIGSLYQIQNDYFDCFGDPKKTGKIGTDIEEGKCTWFIVNAMKRLNEEESKLLLTWYGKSDAAMAKLVGNKYRELKLEQLYKEYEKEMFKSLPSSINSLSLKFLTDIFLFCLHTMFTRRPM